MSRLFFPFGLLSLLSDQTPVVVPTVTLIATVTFVVEADYHTFSVAPNA